MGATEEVIQRALKARGVVADQEPAEGFAVDPDNWDSWCFFMSVQTEWVYGGLGLELRRLKLDMPGIQARLALYRGGRRCIPIRRLARYMADLVVIERQVIETDSRRAMARQQKRR